MTASRSAAKSVSLGYHLVEENIHDAGIESPLGLGPSGRIVILRVAQKNVQLVPEPLGLRLVPRAEAAPDPNARLAARIVPPRRVPEDDRETRPALGLAQTRRIPGANHLYLRCSGVVPEHTVRDATGLVKRLRNNSGTTCRNPSYGCG